MARVKPNLLVYSVFQFINCGIALLALVREPASFPTASRYLTLAAAVLGIGGAGLLLVKMTPGLVVSYVALGGQLMWIRWGDVVISAYSAISLTPRFGQTYSSGEAYVVGFNLVAVFWLIWLSRVARRPSSSPDSEQGTVDTQKGAKRE